MYRIHSWGALGERVDFRAGAELAFDHARHLVLIGRERVHIIDPGGWPVPNERWQN